MGKSNILCCTFCSDVVAQKSQSISYHMHIMLHAHYKCEPLLQQMLFLIPNCFLCQLLQRWIEI